jgi:hypothetical protein
MLDGGWLLGYIDVNADAVFDSSGCRGKSKHNALAA